MADEQTQQLTDDEIEAQALAAAQAGYNKTARGSEPPADEVDAASQAGAQPLTDPASQSTEDANAPGDQGESDLEADPTATAEHPQPNPTQVVSDQLAALRGQVQELASQGGSAAEIRKLHGEIGNINRTLKALQAAATQPAAAPADPELAAALKEAEDVAGEFPEIAGPLVKAIKALQAKAATPAPVPQFEAPQQHQPEVPAEPQVDLNAERARARQQAAIEAIDELHPDRHQIKTTPEFKAWFASKTPEYQQRVTTTWNPAVLAQCFTEFKATQAARKRKQQRLDDATLPQGTAGGQGGPSTIPDEQGYANGYYKKSRQL